MSELLVEGLSAMLIGMGTVLSFLCLMIISMFFMSKIVRKLNEIFPEAIPVSAGNKKVTNSDDSEVAAAIVAAMARCQ
jgi:sodium pump decarboxylase gamma subunit